MKEQYASYEVAKLLKDKGFDWVVNTYYCDDYNYAQHDIIEYKKENYNSHKVHISAPTQQMAMRWLREEKGIYIEFILTVYGTYTFTTFNIPGFNKCSYNAYYEGSEQFNEYEEAVEAALKYCLTELI